MAKHTAQSHSVDQPNAIRMHLAVPARFPRRVRAAVLGEVVRRELARARRRMAFEHELVDVRQRTGALEVLHQRPLAPLDVHLDDYEILF